MDVLDNDLFEYDNNIDNDEYQVELSSVSVHQFDVADVECMQNGEDFYVPDNDYGMASTQHFVIRKYRNFKSVICVLFKHQMEYCFKIVVYIQMMLLMLWTLVQVRKKGKGAENQKWLNLIPKVHQPRRVIVCMCSF